MLYHRLLRGIIVVLVLSMVIAACGATPTATPVPAAPTSVPAAPTPVPPTATPAPQASGCTLRLATTTSTYDTGLLDAILPVFEKENNCHVDVVAVGTGQAIAIGQKGDADVLLVHARSQEDQFVADGYAKQRYDVMYNDFVLVGPKSDPAGVKGMATAKEAFKAIMDKKAPFVSRGDKSGTNTKELAVWSSLGITPTKDMSWYSSIGQGMGDTLVFSNENQAYTLSDRGTWLATASKLPNLTIVVGGDNLTENKDPVLLNPYGVLPVNPDKFPSLNSAMADKFVAWLIGPEGQSLIGSFGVDKFGQQLFYPDASK
jgi:tungstate transport system substrate-binding protein